MRGHVFKRGSTWSYKYDADPGADGRRRQRAKGGFATKKEAQTALSTELTQRAHAQAVEPTKTTMADYLQGQWLPSLHDLRPNTRLSYETLTRLHIVPHIGTVQLAKLTVHDCDRLYATLSRLGPETGRTLSPATIRRIHSIIHAALNSAVDRNLVQRNVSDRVRLPRVPRTKLTTWTSEELRRFLESSAGDRLVALYLLLATTGLRRGEAVGLPWSSVNLDAGTLAVRQAMLSIRYRTELGEPKTRHGERVVALDPVTIEVLAAVREQQRGDAVLLGRGWTNTGLVFSRADGSAWHPEYISRHFETLVQRAGIPKIRLHDLRHTHASMALASGVHLKVMQERLGHSSISVTADLYSHVAPGLQRDAANQIADQALGSWRPAFPNRSQTDATDEPPGSPKQSQHQVSGGAPEGIRTPNLLIRSELWPIPGCDK